MPAPSASVSAGPSRPLVPSPSGILAWGRGLGRGGPFGKSRRSFFRCGERSRLVLFQVDLQPFEPALAGFGATNVRPALRKGGDHVGSPLRLLLRRCQGLAAASERGGNAHGWNRLFAGNVTPLPAPTRQPAPLRFPVRQSYRLSAYLTNRSSSASRSRLASVLLRALESLLRRSRLALG